MRDWMIQSQKINYASLFLAQRLAKSFSVLCSDVWDITRGLRQTFLAKFLVFLGNFCGRSKEWFLWRLKTLFIGLVRNEKLLFSRFGCSNRHSNGTWNNKQSSQWRLWNNTQKAHLNKFAWSRELFLVLNKNCPRKYSQTSSRITTFYFHSWQPQRAAAVAVSFSSITLFISSIFTRCSC